jgi:hypothetical protein
MARTRRYAPNIGITNGYPLVLSEMLRTPEEDQYYSETVVCIHQQCRRDFEDTTFKSFKNYVAYKTE